MFHKQWNKNNHSRIETESILQSYKKQASTTKHIMVQGCKLNIYQWLHFLYKSYDKIFKKKNKMGGGEMY